MVRPFKSSVKEILEPSIGCVSGRIYIMKIVKDFSFGVVPVYKNGGADYLFCAVKHAAGHWAFPKGHKDDGESEEQAARRELFEETGISEIKLLHRKTYGESYAFERNGDRYEKVVKYFLGLTSTMESTIQKEFMNEITDVRWLQYSELTELLTFPEARKVAAEIYEDLQHGV